MNTEALSDEQSKKNKKKNIAGVVLGLFVVVLMALTMYSQIMNAQGI